MKTTLIIIGFLVGSEFIVHLVFHLISRSIGKMNRDKITRASVVKGLIERTFITVTLWNGFSSALTLLGALKIATRIKDTEDKVSNDFFLLGNLVSVLFGVLYYVFIRNVVG